MFRLFVLFISVFILERFASSSNKARPCECVYANFFFSWADELIFVLSVNTRIS